MMLCRLLPLLFVPIGLLVLPASAPARTLKIATIAPEGSAWMQEMRLVGKRIEQGTQGRVRLKFYPGGVMGNDKTVLRKVRAGQLQGGAFTSGALAQVYPDIELYGLPLVFRSYAEVDHVRARMDAQLIAGLEREGFVALALTDGGFAFLMSQRPMRQVGDLAGAKVWVQEGDVMSTTALEIAGVVPVQLSLADVYTALQTGLIDTVGAPAMGAIALQWHTKVKYLTDVPLTYLMGAFVIDEKVFSKLQPADQQVLRQAVAEAAQRLDADSREGERSARRALREHGIEFVSATTPEEVERWHGITREALAVLREKQIYSDASIDQLQRMVEAYRRGARAERGD
ncbi:MAG: TRAP transporter substrate-binding protein DctP [Deltaproteobacteria bacterium]|nr:TRAP transporter substrate-binding protein DctP [Deltaproteobacteria bacterium]MBW2361933.1 TRAP transporter substrate-binding protein DctP [Deltaproteobacteria bacterium]